MMEAKRKNQAYKRKERDPTQTCFLFLLRFYYRAFRLIRSSFLTVRIFRDCLFIFLSCLYIHLFLFVNRLTTWNALLYVVWWFVSRCSHFRSGSHPRSIHIHFRCGSIHIKSDWIGTKTFVLFIQDVFIFRSKAREEFPDLRVLRYVSSCLNPLTPKIWLSILPSSCYPFPWK